tara:strand:- start:2792 stop:3076 length:285 start_codon:yes stop_codon:yes gene_type:complete
MKKKKTVPELFEDRTGVPYENWIQAMSVTHNQEKKRMKKLPYHLKHNMTQWDSTEGYKFWARDMEDAILYLKHMGWALGTLKKIEEDLDANVDG